MQCVFVRVGCLLNLGWGCCGRLLESSWVSLPDVWHRWHEGGQVGLGDLEKTARHNRSSYKPITLRYNWRVSISSICPPAGVSPTGCLPHKVRVLLASTISSFVMIWQVYTPSSPGSTLEMIRSGPSNVYLRKNVSGFRFGNLYLKTKRFSTPFDSSYWQFKYLTFHHCVTQRSSGHFSSTEGPEGAVWGR